MSGSNTNAHSEVGGITSRQILWGPDADSLAVLLNDIHRDAKGFVERGGGARDLLAASAIPKRN